MKLNKDKGSELEINHKEVFLTYSRTLPRKKKKQYQKKIPFLCLITAFIENRIKMNIEAFQIKIQNEASLNSFKELSGKEN